MITDDWEDYSGGAIQCLLLRPTKDHFPILLEGGGGGGDARWPVSFKFENMWFKAKGFKSLILD